MIDSNQMVERLQNVTLGALVFISYSAGRKPTPRAVREAQKARVEGYPFRWFVGRLVSKRTTQKGAPVITVYSTTRYNEDKPSADGHYRTFNPAIGTLHSLEVLCG